MEILALINHYYEETGAWDSSAVTFESKSGCRAQAASASSLVKLLYNVREWQQPTRTGGKVLRAIVAAPVEKGFGYSRLWTYDRRCCIVSTGLTLDEQR